MSPNFKIQKLGKIMQKQKDLYLVYYFKHNANKPSTNLGCKNHSLHNKMNNENLI